MLARLVVVKKQPRLEWKNRSSVYAGGNTTSKLKMQTPLFLDGRISSNFYNLFGIRKGWGIKMNYEIY